MKFSRNLILLLGCLLTTATLSAQTIDSESNVPSYKRVYVFNAGIGLDAGYVWRRYQLVGCTQR